MLRLKVMTIVGTRPELIRLSRVIDKLDRHVDHVLVHTGQNYDPSLRDVFFQELRIRPADHNLACAGSSPFDTIANLFQLMDPLIKDVQPDAILILGDTNSSLAAYVAKRNKVPIFHMEAGNRSHDQNVPEEVNRRIVDHLADINMPYGERARENLVREGFPVDRIVTTGSPMKEVLTYYAADIEHSSVLERLKLQPQGYFVFTAHREEHIDRPEQLAKVAATINLLAGQFGKRVIFSCHPRTRNNLAGMGPLHPLIEVMTPMGFFDFIKLQKHAFAVVSDSGTLTEEAMILDFPAVSIRQSYERNEGMDEAGVILGNLNPSTIANAVELLTAAPNRAPRSTNLPKDYDTDNVSEKVVRSILSFTEYARTKVWGAPLTQVNRAVLTSRPGKTTANVIAGSTILVTGGTGSFGHVVLERLLLDGAKEVRIFSRDEKKQHDMAQAYKGKPVKFYIGDVRDKGGMTDAFRGVDYVFHAAALKQVPTGEMFPMQCLMTNVIGSANVIGAAVEAGVKRVVCLSTDKAVMPTNAMGMTKALMEKVVQSTALISDVATKVCSVRFGNVMGSRGSVIPLFLDQIKQGKNLTVTDPAMTRFMLPISEAVDLVMLALTKGESGDTFIRKSPACTVGQIATTLLRLFVSNVAIDVLGPRPGEKTHETLATQSEVSRAVVMDGYLRIPLEAPEKSRLLGQTADYTSLSTRQLTDQELETWLLALPDVAEDLPHATTRAVA